MKTRNIRQKVVFNASAHEVFELLMDSKKHAGFTGDKASISRKKGGRITAYGDYIEGKNLEIVKDKKIVQSWRSSDWPEGHYSKASFILAKDPKNAKGSVLTFLQEDVPADMHDDIAQGWKDFYWEPMKDALKS
jgi:activator of HSP90 ATPase